MSPFTVFFFNFIKKNLVKWEDNMGSIYDEIQHCYKDWRNPEARQTEPASSILFNLLLKKKFVYRKLANSRPVY